LVEEIMRSTDGLVERSGLELRVPNLRPRLPSAATLPWALLVLAIAAGGYASFEFWSSSLAARAAAERTTAELTLTRQRAFDVEKQNGDTAGQLASVIAENDRLRAEAAPAGKNDKPDMLAAELRKTFAADEGELSAASGKLTLDLADKALFKPGKDELTAPGKKLLRKVGDALNRYPDRTIWVIGHTDEVPAKAGWELSTARSLAVVHYLVEDVKVEPRRLAAAGVGAYRPAGRTSRTKNRRIELVMFGKDAKGRP
jgi:flagellar motor protein MotB